MAIPIADSIHYGDTVVDPHGGRSDLREGVVRAVSEAVFVDDPLRLMRAPRLAAQLGFTIEDGTAQAIKRHAHLIEEVSAERVKDELLKLIAEPDATRSLRLLDDLGLLCRVLPELAEARGSYPAQGAPLARAGPLHRDGRSGRAPDTGRRSRSGGLRAGAGPPIPGYARLISVRTPGTSIPD